MKEHLKSSVGSIPMVVAFSESERNQKQKNSQIIRSFLSQIVNRIP